MSRFPRTTRVLEQAVAARVFPGAVVEVGSATGPTESLAQGSRTADPEDRALDLATIYDLASLTKVLATAALALGLIERGRVGLDDMVSAWSPHWIGVDRHAATVRHLLEHASGLPAHRRFFESLEGRAAFERAIGAESLEYAPGSHSVYSDAGFMLLGLILERAGGATLDAQFGAWCREAVGADAVIGYRPPIEWRARIAPTGMDAWRGRVILGDVHDENAAALGGVAGHAGLFGTAAAVGACARWWMRQAARSATAAEFLRRGRVPGSSRALAWDTALPTSSCGTRMSDKAVGHTGFTGTSLWIDREQDRYVVFLTNRVHLPQTGEQIQSVRRALHDAVAEDLACGG
ncbi:MAG: beta-lactamase family protein [Acidobacteriota bacterium]|nr:beta-lactamase family protein [Acidobacteriota bacterium]